MRIISTNARILFRLRILSVYGKDDLMGKNHVVYMSVTNFVFLLKSNSFSEMRSIFTGEYVLYIYEPSYANAIRNYLET